MNLLRRIHVLRVTNEAERQLALQVMRVTYRDEKGWVRDDSKLIASEDVSNEAVSWFVACDGELPVGVIRVLYEPPLDLYRAYGFRVVSSTLDLDQFIRNNRIAEIGRFAVLSEYRRNVQIVAALMNSAARDTVEREFSHYITDVFEGEQHSPFQFHSRVMGFQVVATHEKGELNCPCRRLTMVLDLRTAYRRLRAQNGWIFRALTNGWEERLHQRLMEDPCEVAAAK